MDCFLVGTGAYQLVKEGGGITTPQLPKLDLGHVSGVKTVRISVFDLQRGNPNCTLAQLA